MGCIFNAVPCAINIPKHWMNLFLAPCSSHQKNELCPLSQCIVTPCKARSLVTHTLHHLQSRQLSGASQVFNRDWRLYHGSSVKWCPCWFVHVLEWKVNGGSWLWLLFAISPMQMASCAMIFPRSCKRIALFNVVLINSWSSLSNRLVIPRALFGDKSSNNVWANLRTG